MKEILLYSGIYSFTAEEFVSKLNQIPLDEDIIVRLNSPGGSVFAGWSIIANLKERTGKNYLKVDGNASSMAFFMIPFFDEVEALDVTSFMVHRATAYVQNEDDQKMLDAANKDLRTKLETKIDADKFKEITGITLSELFTAEKRRDIWLTAKEAKKIGLINKVVRLDPTEMKAINQNLVAFSNACSSRGSEGQLQGSKEQRKDNEISNINNEKTKKMTKAELKSQNPELYAEIFNSGVNAEKDRIEAWLAFADLDLDAVKKGINDNSNVSQKVMAEMSRKAIANASLDNIKKENAEATDTPEEKPGDTKKTEEEIKAEKELKDAENEAFAAAGLQTAKK